MDFIKELIELNNIVYLDQVAEKRGLGEVEKKEYIHKYNKGNNRLFVASKSYMIDEYRKKINS
jgi:hypothetical protein|tara:strand:- start:838 stop:1026 length:189 start_codon:yes stop_codon:yes gene_type:complete